MVKNTAHRKRKTHTRKRQRQLRARINKTAALSRKIAIWSIVVAVVMVVLGALIFMFLRPQAVVERELASLAKDYYEHYYYDKLGDRAAEQLAKYESTGLPSVQLQQLLSFDNHRHEKSKSAFNRSGYVCDLGATTVKYYPAAPYGRTDYTVKYNYSCTEE